jgi:hypothetical protein
MFKHSANKAAEYAQNMHKAASGLWGAFRQPAGKSATTISQPVGLLPAPASSSASSSGGWGRWAPAAFAVGGALVAGAAAGTAYYHRTDIESSYAALTDHMQYVGTLWDKNGLLERVRRLVEHETVHSVVFRTWVVNHVQ